MNVEEVMSATIEAANGIGRFIEALTIMKPSEAMIKLENRVRKKADERPSTEAVDTFLVSDIFRNASYLVSQFDTGIQLLVPSEDCLTLVKLDLGADVPEVADSLLNQLSQ